HPNGSQSRSQPVHPGIQGRDGRQEALGYEREYQATRQGDGHSRNEDRRLDNVTGNNERQGIGSRRGDPGGQESDTQEWQTQAQNSRSTEWGSASSDLARWVMQWSEENELETSGLDNHLLTLAKDIES
ncbi:hypothetical protein ACSYAD_35805, partial [Acaryochloris marina NIES-2412]|uniref:hypothetical protein n=1 Tax=Acaryochloris marina TaxID=155978 RepID=UPI00405A0F7B